MKEPELPEFYFCHDTGEYFMQIIPGKYVVVSKQDVKMHLRKAGLSKDKYHFGLNELENAIAKCQIERYIDYAGPLAGHKPGVFLAQSRKRILITESASLPVAKRGSIARIMQFIEELFADPDFGGIQKDVVLAWLKCARASYFARDFRAGQMLAMAGESGCGKSLFQHLITEWLGGRVGMPFKYMNGETAFNADLAEAEHLMLEDKGAASFDLRTRRKFGESVKDFVVCRVMSVHGKGLKAEPLPTFRRVSMTLNNEPENLLAHPPLDPSIMDKTILTHCSPATVSNDEKLTWRNLTSELPALAYHLEKWELPEEMKDRRYGMKSWHHPALVEILTTLSDETRLMDIIDQVLFVEQPNLIKAPWEGTSEELESKLVNSSLGFAASKVLSKFTGACGTYLGRLKSKSDRIESVKRKGRTFWRIKWPE